MQNKYSEITGDVTLNDGTVVRCRQDSSTMWMIYIPKGLPRGGGVLGMKKPTVEENFRCTIANVATNGKFFDYTHLNVKYDPRVRGVHHPEGWFDNKDCYRNEADEAAVISRWCTRTHRRITRISGESPMTIHANTTAAELLESLKVYPDLLAQLTGLLRKAKVAGPWVPAKAPGMEIGDGWWRIRAQGPGSNHWEHGDVVVVCPSQILHRPETIDFIYDGGYRGDSDDYDYDEEAYEEAISEYKRVKALWKEWTWRVDEAKGFADTREEAMKLGDESLLSTGWILSDSPST